MVDNLDIDPKVPVLTGKSLKDFKTYQRASKPRGCRSVKRIRNV